MTNKLNLQNWLSGSNDYCPEGNVLHIKATRDRNPSLLNLAQQVDQAQFTPYNYPGWHSQLSNSFYQEVRVQAYQALKDGKLEQIPGLTPFEGAIAQTWQVTNLAPLVGEQLEVALQQQASESKLASLSKELANLQAELPDLELVDTGTSLYPPLNLNLVPEKVEDFLPTTFKTSVNQAEWMYEPDLAKRAQICLNKCFALHEFRGLQKDIVQSLLEQNDVLAIMATGMGKSLCYQVPGMCLPGVTLVVSPLIALMEDQVAQLRANGIGAAIYNSQTTPAEREQILQAASQGSCKFLYVSPEKLASNFTLRDIASLPINLIAIDEAHCVSQWGHDFRPDYRNLARLRQILPNYVPMLACTATARMTTRQDILENLQLTNARVFVGDFNRPNIGLYVESVEDYGHAYRKIVELCRQSENLPAIIYCNSRKGTEKLDTYLRGKGIKSAIYHAGLMLAEREDNFADFMSGEVEVMVATIAFGMGVNKSNVRMVIHMDYPSTLENYYQEIGRAGRDGEKAKAILFDFPAARDWRISRISEELHASNRLPSQTSQLQQDKQLGQAGAGEAQSKKQNKGKSKEKASENSSLNTEEMYQELLVLEMNNPLIDQQPEKSPEMKFKKLKEVFDFCDTANCRRRVLLSAFNQVVEHDCGNCDICLDSKALQDKIEIGEDAHFILGLVIVARAFLSVDTMIKMITGKASIAAELERALQIKLNYCYSREEYERVVNDLAKISSWEERIKVKTEQAYQYGAKYWRAVIEQLLALGYLSYDRKYNYVNITSAGHQLLKERGTIKVAAIPDLVKRNIFIFSLIRDLEKIRVEIGKAFSLRYDAVLSDPTMSEIADKLPDTENELEQIQGMTQTKVKRFGKLILEAVKRYRRRVALNNVSAK
ncbi:hypothetical protein CKF54_03645 [Psittacicella hinzii]|uniref:ATP-dependent DNA helicase RecQ n=1 Tax=Psittacicella hinzii TaxID=2028575 RepID=A0A3A1Y6V4_9GAMM|nr:ATP-dependent DNA helicase RecQ [Psittacicella hinzii]RIY33036.1 hypothetical protein CKF54_03645 [Psittacicella hinzii]